MLDLWPHNAAAKKAAIKWDRAASHPGGITSGSTVLSCLRRVLSARACLLDEQSCIPQLKQGA
ncbi:hypothetical protein [Desulfosporosinus burensis]